MNSIENLIRPELRNLKPYSSARREIQNGEVWLNANENPWQDSNLIMQVVNQHDICINRYPEPQPTSLRQRLAEIYQVDSKNILLIPGSDDGVDLLVRLFCRAYQDAIVICPPTFGMYRVCADIQAVNVVKVPLLKQRDFEFDVNRILDTWSPVIKLIFLCSPNNPTGNAIALDDILVLCEALAGKAVVVTDEAYIEFANSNSAVERINTCMNLVVLRTLSKAYGLAAIRCGALLANEIIIEYLQNIIKPYPLSQLSVVTALEVLSPRGMEIVQQRVNTLIDEREKLAQELQKSALIEKIWPSKANFLLVKTKELAKFLQQCANDHVVIRNVSDKLNLENCVRITVGTAEENQRLLAALEH